MGLGDAGIALFRAISFFFLIIFFSYTNKRKNGEEVFEREIENAFLRGNERMRILIYFGNNFFYFFFLSF